MSLKTGKKANYFAPSYLGSLAFHQAFYAVLQTQPPVPPTNTAYSTCKFCGHTLAPGTKICSNCHAKPNNPVIAAALSILLPGLGQVYNKKYLVGGIHMILAAFTIGLFYGHFANMYVMHSTVVLYVAILQHVVNAVISVVHAYKDAAFVSD